MDNSNTNFITKVRDFFSTSSYSRTLSILALLIVAAAVPLTLSNLGKQQDIRQRASGDLDHCAGSDGKRYISDSPLRPSNVTCTGWDQKTGTDPANRCKKDPLNVYFYDTCTGNLNISAEIVDVSPLNPRNNEDVTITFKVSGDTSYVNLWVGGPTVGGPKDDWTKDNISWVRQVKTSVAGQTYTLIWPHDHPAYKSGNQKIGILPYFSFYKADSGDFDNIGGQPVSQPITIGGGGGVVDNAQPSGSFAASCPTFTGTVSDADASSKPVEVDFWLEAGLPGNDFTDNRFLGSATSSNNSFTFDTSSLNTIPNDQGKTYNPRTSFFAGTPRSVSAFALNIKSDGTRGTVTLDKKLGVKSGLICPEGNATLTECKTPPNKGGICDVAGKTYNNNLYVRSTDAAQDSWCASRTANTVCYVQGTPNNATSTKLNLSLKLGAIGGTGDNNPDPKTTTKDFTVCIYALTADPTTDAANSKCDATAVPSITKTLSFDKTNGRYSSATFEIGSTLTTGQYQVFVKSGKYLRKRIPGTPTITAGATNQMPQTTLIQGDINGDNRVDIRDYNELLKCFDKNVDTEACKAADVDDSGGKVDGVDQHFLIESLSVKDGD